MSLVWEFVKRWPVFPSDHIQTIHGNPSIVCVKMGIRRISWLLLGLNHWSVLLGLSNGQWVCVQFHNNGAITTHVANYERDAALCTTPLGYQIVRTSIYGPTHRPIYWSDVVKWLKYRQGGYYLPGVRDCQNFSRQLIRWLTLRWVGVWPIENGDIFFPSLSNNYHQSKTSTLAKFNLNV